jgi:ferredoxin/flavodoxin---NADP+ reductase
MSNQLGTSGNPVRVAIVGSGPAGFYAAGQLLGNNAPVATVDLYDRLATPWGLVRFGVAPDHPKIKSVTRVFEKTAKQPGFRFHGNVEIGSDLTHEQLTSAYHAVLYAVGTPDDRKLGVPGENLRGSESATEFVAWYNGHPDYADKRYDLSAKRVVVVGNGNVAIDVARMLLLSADELAATDTADHAIEALRSSQVEEVVVVGRRGPVQAAFTNPELRELAGLELADVSVSHQELELDPLSAAALENADATTKRNVETLNQLAQAAAQDKPRRIVLRFLQSPVEIQGDGRVEAIVTERNELVARDDGTIAATPTGATERIETGLVLRSIGYIGKPLPGVPFDDRRKTILNAGGRVLNTDTRHALPGVYTAGWVKRGPSGVIGTNKKCAQETVALLLEDLSQGKLPEPSIDPDMMLERLAASGHQVVDYNGWEAIDAHERRLGEPIGRPRVKLVDREHLLHHARRADRSGEVAA